MIPARLATPPAADLAPAWGQTLYDGAPGITLLHAEHAHTTGDPTGLHPWVRAMTTRPLDAHPQTGLYRGVPAVAFAVRASLLPDHPSRTAYLAALAALDHRVDDLARERLHRARDRQARSELPQFAEYDLIQGLTGIGAYLLHRDPATPLLPEILAYLVTLTRPITQRATTLPGWWVPTAPTGRPDAQWPYGHANLGLAHGIAGPLALLALAHRHGLTVPGHTEAIAAILDWYDTHRADNPWWPATITNPSPTAADHPGRPSWCYGTPGITRAHQLAALALGDTGRAADAEQILTTCLRDPAQLDQLTDTSLCHGLAGAVLTAWRAAADAGPDSTLTALLPDLRDQLAHRLQHNPPHPAGLLDGLAGAVLAHHTTGTPTPPPTRWDHCLLIAG